MVAEKRGLSTAAAEILLVLLAAVGGCSPSGPGGSDRSSAAAGPLPTAAAGQREDPAPAGSATPERPVLLSDREIAEGWISLFDGKTLFGWKPTSEADWRVEDGCIVVSRGDPGLLCTTTRFADFVLELEVRSQKGANSGVFLRSPPNLSDVTKDCYELNIADADNPFPTGSLVKRQRAEDSQDTTDWQSLQVTVDGGKVDVLLDGRAVLHYIDPAPPRRGHIGLQRNEGTVAFRSIKLKPLGMVRMFNGKDLAGWKTYPEMPSRFTVTEEGWLNVKDGRGQLETDSRYGDFVLQLECLTHAPNLNSGIFFRCIPGDQMMGYECQIHNGYRDGDRAQPIDCGTGGIFRRQDARCVVADDLRWFSLALIADGPHMAAWVDGYQVSDWTDQRPPHENPRKGLRLEPGTIMIQGHDPSTNISFRNLRIGEL